MASQPSAQFTIRKATVADTEAIRRMHAESWMAAYPSEKDGVSYAWVRNYTSTWLTHEAIEESKGIVSEAINDPDGFYRLAETDGHVVGFVHAATNQDASKELEAIYTHPDTFGTGLGAALMDLAMEWIGDTKATLQVVTYNVRAIKFYKKHGFVEVPNTTELYKGKIPMMQMRREAT